MQQITVNGARWQQDSDGAWLCLRVQSPTSAMTICDEMKPDKQYVAQIKRKGRSLDANAYCWVLMDKLAAHYGATKEGIYQEEIRQIAGVSDIVCVQEKAADELMRRWSGRGIGWMAEKELSKLHGCVNVTLWYGSSTYDTEQMSRLIDRVVEDCREAGIETMTPQQLAALKSQWGEAQPIG